MRDRLDAFYDTLIAATPGSTARAGQREMLQLIGEVLERARFEPDAAPQIAVVEAGTGVGKTRAYLAAGLLMARAAKVKLVVSTSTVALQEQVVFKDLPELSRALDEPPTIALLKGRGRYVCPIRLNSAVNGDQEPLALEADDTDTPLPLDGTMERLTRLQQRLRSAQWDGERDSLATADLALWPSIAAERNSCTSRHCPEFNRCPYFDAKRAASKAEVLVTNHDFVLASLRSDQSSIPSGERAIFVFDEGHHLPATALAHFACEASLTDRRWPARLEKALGQAASALRYPGQGFDGSATQLGQALDDLLAGLLASIDASAAAGTDDDAEPRRLVLAAPDEALMSAWQSVERVSQRWHDRALELSAWMREVRQTDEDLAGLIAQFVADIGGGFRRLHELLSLAQLMQRSDDPPPARWLLVQTVGGALRVIAKASPLFAGGVLADHLWPRLRGAVVTSATLRALGKFDFFLREAGLQHLGNVQAKAVSSPFNYAAQGSFLTVVTRSSPRDASAHTREVTRLLARDLESVERGALVLCSSWAQLREVVANLPPAGRAQMRVQGEAPREQLLREHRQAVRSGERSVLVGLQSFGEGLDLPGQECEWVFLLKLPFLTPDDPVAQARAQWLSTQGRNPFAELVVPATGVRLNQWVGRGIRTETDRATIVCYDPRLTQTSFGRQLLAGLPPFRKIWRLGTETDERPLP